jgi:hypothetical protein
MKLQCWLIFVVVVVVGQKKNFSLDPNAKRKPKMIPWHGSDHHYRR